MCTGALLLLLACTGDPVGDPCLQEQFPAGGYDPAETYVESGSPECQTRVCVVHGLRGDPRPDCEEGCAPESEVLNHVYCSCRCDDEGTAPPCACPTGFSCEPTGRAGSFCLREIAGEL